MDEYRIENIISTGSVAHQASLVSRQCCSRAAQRSRERMTVDGALTLLLLLLLLLLRLLCPVRDRLCGYA